MGAKLIHYINKAWLTIELKRLVRGDIHRLCLAVANNEEARSTRNIVKEIWSDIWSKTPAEIKDKFTSISKEHNYHSYKQWEENHTDNSENAYIMMVSEEWFKQELKLPNNYDSFLMSHEVHDVFFKSAIIQNCK
jgi:hypothetical protein